MERLKIVTEEEGRMAAAETLKAIYNVGDSLRVQGIHDAVRDFKEVKQGVDDRVKGIGDMAVIGAQKMLNLSSLSPIFIILGVERTGRPMESGLAAIGAESLKTTNDSDSSNKIEYEYVDNMTQGSMRDTLEGASDGAGNIGKVQGPIKGTGVRGVGGAHIIRNPSSEPLPSVS